MSDRFGAVLKELVLDAFPDGVVDDESVLPLSSMTSCSATGSRAAHGEWERFIAERRDLDETDKALLLCWLANVQGVFEITEPYGDDGVIVFNHVDEPTYRVRSNMGTEGVELLAPDDHDPRHRARWRDLVISGTPMAFPAGHADQVLAGVPEIVTKFPSRAIRYPEKLAQGRELQAEQRAAFIDLHGADLVVVPGDQRL